MEKSLAWKIRQRADNSGLSISCYIRSQLEKTIDHILGKEDAKQFRQHAAKLELTDYEFARRILLAYLKSTEARA